MVTLISKKTGESHDFEFDWEMAVQMDREGKSLFSLMDEGEELSFVAIDSLAKVMGTTYPGFARMGFTIEDLTTLLMKALEELGFISEPQETTTSTQGLRAGLED